MRATSPMSLKSRVFLAVSATLLMMTLASCSSESEPTDIPQSVQDNADETDSAETADAAANSASHDTTNSDREIRHPKLLAGIPVIDGDYQRRGAGRLTNGSTAYESFNVTTGLPWQEAADKVRQQLTDAGFAEKSWAAYADARYDVRAHGLFEQGERLIVVEVEEDGQVAYSVHEMPSGSYAEQNYACDTLRKFGASAAMLPMLTTLQGGTVSAEQVDFQYAFVAGMIDRLPPDVATPAEAFYDAVAATIGKDAKAVASGSDLATAVKTAKAASTAATDAYCKG